VLTAGNWVGIITVAAGDCYYFPLFKIMHLQHIVDFSSAIDLLNFHHHGIVLAQAAENTDLLKHIQVTWDDFLKTGKAGAFAFGLILGYVVRGIFI
jgi:hypothetical protein